MKLVFSLLLLLTSMVATCSDGYASEYIQLSKTRDISNTHMNFYQAIDVLSLSYGKNFKIKGYVPTETIEFKLVKSDLSRNINDVLKNFGVDNFYYVIADDVVTLTMVRSSSRKSSFSGGIFSKKHVYNGMSLLEGGGVANSDYSKKVGSISETLLGKIIEDPATKLPTLSFEQIEALSKKNLQKSNLDNVDPLSDEVILSLRSSNRETIIDADKIIPLTQDQIEGLKGRQVETVNPDIRPFF